MYVSITDYFPVVGLTQLTKVQAGGQSQRSSKTVKLVFTKFDVYVHPLTLFSFMQKRNKTYTTGNDVVQVLKNVLISA